MSGAVPANPRIQFPSSTGGLLPGGFVDVFTAGTTTRVTTWQDKALTTPNQNPIALDTAGSCSLWTDSTQTYDFVVRDANLVAQYTLHNIVAAGVAPTVPVFNVDTFSGNGSQTAFTLSSTPAGINNTDVYVSGVYQKKSAYSLAGNTLNFVAAPASGTNNIEVNTYNVTEYSAVAVNMAAQVTAATTQATAAAASRTAIDDRLYPGTFSVAPTLRPDGTAIQNGDRYVNSSDGTEYIRVGGAWSNGANQAQAAANSATTAANYAAATATGAKFFNAISQGVTPGTLAAATYYYKVTALTAAGETTGSSEASVVTTGSPLSIALSWGAITGATGYKVYRGTVAGSENTFYSPGNVTNFSDTGAAGTGGTVPVSNTATLPAPSASAPSTATTGGTLAAATYFYKITALNGAGETVGSGEVSQATTGTTSTVSLSWGAVTGATSYRVYRGTSAGVENVYYAPGNVTTFIDTGAANTVGSPPGSNTATIAAPAITSSLTSVATGSTFGVIAGGIDNLTRPSIYKNVDGTAGNALLLYGVLPATEYDLDRTHALSNAFAVSDADGNAVVLVEAASGLAITGNGIDTTQVAVLNQVMRWNFALADADGNIGHGVNSSGKIAVDITAATGYVAPIVGGVYDYDINHYMVYGQSESVGQATPVQSTVQHYDNLMFTFGMRPQYDYPGNTDAQNYGTFVPAVEALSPTNPALAETPMLGMSDQIKMLMLSEESLDFSSQSYQMLLSTPGYGAMAILDLAKGTAHYTRLLTQVTYGVSNAAAANKTYGVPAVGWWQGVQDNISGTTQADYYKRERQLVADLNTDIKARTSQTKSIPLITYQVASHLSSGVTTPLVALAQLQAEADDPLIYMAMSMYHFDYFDGYHLTGAAERWAGAYQGLVTKRIVNDGIDWKPLKPISSTVSGKVACIKFNVPVGKLVLDTTLVNATTNFGFDLVDSVGNPLTISSVSLRGKDTVKIVAAANIPAGAKVNYAWTGSGGGTVGRLTGPRGNLRDQQGEAAGTISGPGGKSVGNFDPSGTNKTMHNWCVIFQWSL